MSPVNLVNLDGVTKAWGTTVVLDALSIGVGVDDRIGVVGRNGGGKSTLLSIIAGHEPADDGRVTQTGGITIGRLAQGDALDPTSTVIDAVVGAGVDTHEWASDAGVRTVLDGLVRDIDRDAVIKQLSGGERRRVALAALLVRDPDLVCLDEPTNHLDVEAVSWLAGHLKGRRGAHVIVTHDRWFLDEVTDQTWEVADGQVHTYDGGYAAYVLARAERQRQADSSEQRRQNLLRKEIAWLRRGPPARTTKPKFRIDAANALIADVPPPRDSVRLQKLAGTRLGKDVVDVEDATLSYGDRVLLGPTTWRLGPGDRIGLLGPNGAGKSTLLHLITGQLKPTAGKVRIGQTVKIAELSQEIVELDPTRRVLQALEDVAQNADLGDGKQMSASQLLETLGFPASRQWTPVGDLSGGEKRRLQLMRLLMIGPNLLLLDEPTNDLDIDTLTELEDLLDGFPGTLVVVSHDRWFLERTCDQLWALPGNGTLRHLPGGVEDYLKLRAALEAGPASAGGQTKKPAADSRTTKKELSRIERRLERIESETNKLHGELAANSTDHVKVLELNTTLNQLATEHEELEAQWLEWAEQT